MKITLEHTTLSTRKRTEAPYQKTYEVETAPTARVCWTP
jgi:hypothetical protein